jgi:magnesium transporter
VLMCYRNSQVPLQDDNLSEWPEDVIWIDLLNPTEAERAFVESGGNIRVPSIEALSEIETSSRLVFERNVIYLSTPLVAQSDTPDPFLSPAGFVLSPKLLVTIRFAELSTFATVAAQTREDDSIRSSAGVFTALLEALVDRAADVLELLGKDLDKISKSVFRGDPNRRMHTVRSNRSLRVTLSTVGTTGDRLSQARDVLLGLGRIAPYVESLRLPWIVPEFEKRLGAVSKDISSLNDYQAHLSNLVQFLLDAILGFITIEQNDLFKVLTIVSVIGIPPTLVAGIYGMNFKYMPELNWVWGYPFGLAVIILSALIPVVLLKWRGWI